MVIQLQFTQSSPFRLQRCMDEWNCLPDSVIMAKSANDLRMHLTAVLPALCETDFVPVVLKFCVLGFSGSF